MTVDATALSTGEVTQGRTAKPGRSVLAGLGLSGSVALAFLALMLVVALFAPLIAPHDPDTGNLLAVFQGGSAAHWLGTDGTGRDIASRLIYGSRTSLLGPAAIVGLSLVVGVPFALLAAWRGGWTAFLITRLFDVLFAIPGLLLAILAISIFGTGLKAAIIALAIAYLPYTARLVVAIAERERRMSYISTLSAQGHGALRITFVHLLRNIAPVLAGQATVSFAYALIDLASLSFLGLAVQAPQADWGVLVSDRTSLLQGHPTQVISAAAAIVLTVLSLFVLGSRLSGDSVSTIRRSRRLRRRSR